jgi:glycogen(starch) synthase
VKILISSHAFEPSIGGIETVSRLLAEQFFEAGHSVVVVTQTPSHGNEILPYTVMRQPSLTKLFDLVRWSDIYWQNNLSLRTLWPALLIRRPVVITHQGSYCRRPQGLDLVQRVKHAIVNRLPSIAISNYVASCVDGQSLVIPNPYDRRVFSPEPLPDGRKGLVFVGRLVAEKGVDLLLEALARLRSKGISPHLTIVGAGPDRSHLQKLADRLEISNHVTFAGAHQPREVAIILKRHQILVVPSRYDEPLGIVALEGIACGCLVIASCGGGLSEAVGPCGTTVPNGDVDALADAIEQLLIVPEEGERRLASVSEHLARFQPESVASRYLEVFQSIVPK